MHDRTARDQLAILCWGQTILGNLLNCPRKYTYVGSTIARISSHPLNRVANKASLLPPLVSCI